MQGARGFQHDVGHVHNLVRDVFHVVHVHALQDLIHVVDNAVELAGQREYVLALDGRDELGDKVGRNLVGDLVGGLLDGVELLVGFKRAFHLAHLATRALLVVVLEPLDHFFGIGHGMGADLHERVEIVKLLLAGHQLLLACGFPSSPRLGRG